MQIKFPKVRMMQFFYGLYSCISFSRASTGSPVSPSKRRRRKRHSPGRCRGEIYRSAHVIVVKTKPTGDVGVRKKFQLKITTTTTTALQQLPWDSHNYNAATVSMPLRWMKLFSSSSDHVICLCSRVPCDFYLIAPSYPNNARAYICLGKEKGAIHIIQINLLSFDMDPIEMLSTSAPLYPSTRWL